MKNQKIWQKIIIGFVVLINLVGFNAHSKSLKFESVCILETVLNKMGFVLDSKKPLPQIFFESKVPLKQFQDAIEPQWGMRPDVFLNAYVVNKNEIYLIDDPHYYTKTGRFIEDSLAHEFVHYIQVIYRNNTLDGADDSQEMEAIDIQTWFRDTYMSTTQAPSCATPQSALVF